MASSIFNGTNLLLKIAADGDTPATVGHTTSCTISFSADMADVTTKDSDGYTEIIPGTRSGEISFDGLVDYTDSMSGASLGDFLLTRAKVDFSFGTVATGDKLYTGEGYLTSLEISAEAENAATYSGSVQITGAIVASVN